MDVAIRIGHLPDSAQVARRLGEATFVVCASPDYIAQHGAPLTPKDLHKHDCLYYRNHKTALNNWLFKNDQGEETIAVDGPLSINESTSLIEAAEKNMGVLWIDKIVAADSLAKGRLVPILENYSLSAGFPIYAIYPARRHLSSKTRVFIDFLAERFSSRIADQAM
jgi:DNA-binding transcriptional LysR family regulator